MVRRYDSQMELSVLLDRKAFYESEWAHIRDNPLQVSRHTIANTMCMLNIIDKRLMKMRSEMAFKRVLKPATATTIPKRVWVGLH